ncbi:MAG: cation:proton antiporter [Pirellulales bacterium]|nr:cation:proton antiporter [Pirellulales bacterium]
MEWPGATTTLGMLMTAALLAGVVGQLFRLPKVTSYLLMGVLLGPSLLDCVPRQHFEQIEPLTKLAIALVLFNLGCHFPLARARRILRRVLRLSLGELGATFLLVAIGLLLLGAGWETALLLGALGLATAPATTILVLKETESEGSVTEYTNALVALNNLASIVAFELLFLAILLLHGELRDSPLAQLAYLARDLAGSIVLGAAAGLTVSYCYGLVAEARRLVLLVGAITLALGLCLAFDVPYLLTFLAMGATVANSSYQTRHVLAELDRLTGLLCVVFFVTHGVDLDVHKLYLAGAAGVGYLAFRAAGKYLGIRLAAQTQHEEPEIRNWLGLTLMSQAGAAIALSSIAVQRTAKLSGTLPQICEDVQTVILGTVVVFEIAGPLLIRQAVLCSGEVPLAQAVHHPGVGPVEQLRAVWNRVLIAFGLDPWGGRSEGELTIRQLMRKNVRSVPQSATFDDVVACIEHSRDNTFPVVDQTGDLIGVIRYRELSHALFDRKLGPLVRATDVTTPARQVLYPDEPISRASQIFARSKDDCIPVIAAEEPHQFLGVVRRRDVLRLLIREWSG